MKYEPHPLPTESKGRFSSLCKGLIIKKHHALINIHYNHI